MQNVNLIFIWFFLRMTQMKLLLHLRRKVLRHTEAQRNFPLFTEQSLLQQTKKTRLRSGRKIKRKSSSILSQHLNQKWLLVLVHLKEMLPADTLQNSFALHQSTLQPQNTPLAKKKMMCSFLTMPNTWLIMWCTCQCTREFHFGILSIYVILWRKLWKTE